MWALRLSLPLSNAMTGKNSSRKSVKVVKTVLEAVLKIDANTASSWIAYQPEMPSEIKKFKKVR